MDKSHEQLTNELQSMPELVDLARNILTTEHQVLGEGAGQELRKWTKTEKVLAKAIVGMDKMVTSHPCYPAVPMTRAEFLRLPLLFVSKIPEPSECRQWVKRNKDGTWGVWRYVLDNDVYVLEIGTALILE